LKKKKLTSEKKGDRQIREEAASIGARLDHLEKSKAGNHQK